MTEIELQALTSIARGIPSLGDSLRRIAKELSRANMLKAIELGVNTDGVIKPHPQVTPIMKGCDL